MAWQRRVRCLYVTPNDFKVLLRPAWHVHVAGHELQDAAHKISISSIVLGMHWVGVTAFRAKAKARLEKSMSVRARTEPRQVFPNGR